MNTNIQLKANLFKNSKNRFLRIIFGNQLKKKICNAKILIVGAGGLGCEIIKNLCKFGIQKITVIDMDIIQETNLNRQFYFNNQDVGKSKSKILKQKILTINPNLNIQTYQDNIYNPKFNYSFYAKFDVVFSALDSMSARQFLAKNVTKYSTVLIDAGTSGYNGQCYPSIRYLTSCHNCYKQNIEEQYAICSIRSRPQKNIHCAVYAKTLYELIFLENAQTKYIQSNLILTFSQNLLNLMLQGKLLEFQNQCVNFFNHIFSDNIKTEDINGNQIIFCKKINFKDAIQMHDWPSISVIQKKQIQYFVRNFDKVLSLKEYAEGFILSLKILMQKKLNNNLNLQFNKDDDNCCVFAGCVTNLRIYNFKNQKNENNKLKFLTFFQCKQMIGKIIPAIASTNSIAAALQVKQFINIVSQKTEKCRYSTINYFSEHKIESHFLSFPNKQCEVCSYKNLYYQIQCNFQQTTFSQFQQFAIQNCFSKGRSIYCGSLIIVKNGENIKKVSPNKQKKINFKSDLIVQNTITLTFLADQKVSNLNVQVILINVQNKQNKFLLIKHPLQKQLKAALCNQNQKSTCYANENEESQFK